MNKNSMSYTAIFSFIITFVLVFFLALTHNSTKSRVAEYNKNYEVEAILKTIGIEPNKDNLQGQFESIFNIETPTNDTMSANVDGEDVVVGKFSGKALWGTVNGIIAMDKELKTIKGIEIISHNETPGLGGRIEEEWFLKQFRGEQLKDSKIRVVQGTGIGNYDSSDGIIDGVVGASRTSDSIEVMINEKIASLKGEGENE